MGWPRSCCRPGCSKRAVTSTPPGAKGTTRWIGRSGNPWADAVAQQASPSASNNALIANRDRMKGLFPKIRSGKPALHEIGEELRHHVFLVGPVLVRPEVGVMVLG